MIGTLLTWVAFTLGLFVAAKLLDGMEIKGGLGSHLVVGGLFGVLNAVFGPPLFVALGLVTLGLSLIFSFVARLVVSAIVLVVVDKLSDRVKVKTFGTAVLAALIVSVASTVVEAAAANFL